MRQEKLLKIIEQALKDGVTSLDLNRCQLKALPPEISQLTNLNRKDGTTNNGEQQE
jgi:hypothetical protein